MLLRICYFDNGLQMTLYIYVNRVKHVFEHEQAVIGFVIVVSPPLPFNSRLSTSTASFMRLKKTKWQYRILKPLKHSNKSHFAFLAK